MKNEAVDVIVMRCCIAEVLKRARSTTGKLQDSFNSTPVDFIRRVESAKSTPTFYNLCGYCIELGRDPVELIREINHLFNHYVSFYKDTELSSEELRDELLLELSKCGNLIAIQCRNLSYSQALEKIKNSYKVAREHWVEKHQYLFLVSGAELARRIDTSTVITDQLWIRSNKGITGPYTPSGCDQMANDWIVIE